MKRKSSSKEIGKDISDIALTIEAISEEINKSIIGQRDIVRYILLSILSGGHVLIEGVPGLAKTLIVKSIAQALNCHFKRIQFTPDLLPADITGTEIFTDKGFKFIKGPLFANLILADEINRATPKTQSALLESMEEKQITIANKTYNLEKPFIVIATQNPIEQEATFPLPEAQKDRFFAYIEIGYPSIEDELQISVLNANKKLSEIKQVANKVIFEKFESIIEHIAIGETLMRQIVMIVQKSRPQNNKSLEIIKQYVQWGIGPRALQHLIKAARAAAIFNKRNYVIADDFFYVFDIILKHRFILNFNALSENITVQDILNRLRKMI